ncbi:tyrosine-type recombinase/integrase [Delftia tsuruhatensis]|uniref:tyrosine-type recombinase/integrase n=1 Tax=Delftia tsuruhatensis TaxID=180282 RepID=UPI0020278394|nr:tyrosine-type recombinase/integrase [Delftia tsuruhatensis]
MTSDSQQNDINEKVAFGTTAVDENDQALEPPVPARTTRRRGRPPGAKTRAANTHITADEFAVLRAVAQGIDVGIASRQYLLWTSRVPERAKLLENFGLILARIEAGAKRLPDAGAARRMVRGLLALQAEVVGAEESKHSASAPPEVQSTVPGAPERPSLEEFASRFDEDMFSEADLIRMYEEDYPDEPSAAAPPVGQALGAAGNGPSPQTSDGANSASALSAVERTESLLTAIDWLDNHLGRRPSRNDRVEQWLRINAKQRQALNEVGVLTLGNLVDWMALRGDEWYGYVPGYGVRRAEDIRLWMARWSILPAQGLKQRALVPQQDPAGERGPQLAPLSQLNWPEHLRGHDGMLRTHAPNSLGAGNDMEAVTAWFQLIRQKSAATQVAYRRAIERLVLWAVNVRLVSLSSMTLHDLLAFKDFLSDPPAEWVQDRNAPRTGKAEEWRPLRGPLSDTSLEVTFVAIGSMFRSWHTSGYLTSDPADGIVGSKRKDAKMDVMRSFSEQEREVIGRTFSEMKDGYAKRRLAAIIRILESAGLRREELAKATWGHLSRLRIDGRDTEQWGLRVEGKGLRVRNVPINLDTYAALLAHKEDRLALQARGLIPKPDKENDMPLIGLLDDRWIESRKKMKAIKEKETDSENDGRQLVVAKDQRFQMVLVREDGSHPQMKAEEKAGQNSSKNHVGGLSAAAIYSLLKQFFLKCSEVAGELPSEKRTTFKRASTHWLRHTFAHHVLKATGKDLTVAQSLLGHSSINTTAIYVKADMQARAAAVNAVRPSV